jgi:hypothetical protein
MAHKECQDPARKKRNGKLIPHECLCLSLEHSERDDDFSEFLVDHKGTSRFNLTFGRSRSPVAATLQDTMHALKVSAASHQIGRTKLDLNDAFIYY